MDTSSGLAFEDLLTIIRRHPVPIYNIAPRPSTAEREAREVMFGEVTSWQDYELKALAKETGGRAFFPVTVTELSTVYDSIADELAHQYSLGYLSTNRARDGSFRHILIRIAGVGLHWRTRSGYLADRASSPPGSIRR